MTVKRLRHEFVELIPGKLEDGIIYISFAYATAVHRCCCGCGNEVVTPFSPTDWKLTFDGESISLDPSVGNWSFDCKSHYWIESGMVNWAPRWSQRQIEEGRARDRVAKNKYFDEKQKRRNSKSRRANADKKSEGSQPRLLSALKKFLS